MNCTELRDQIAVHVNEAKKIAKAGEPHEYLGGWWAAVALTNMTHPAVETVEYQLSLLETAQASIYRGLLDTALADLRTCNYGVQLSCGCWEVGPSITARISWAITDLFGLIAFTLTYLPVSESEAWCVQVAIVGYRDVLMSAQGATTHMAAVALLEKIVATSKQERYQIIKRLEAAEYLERTL